MLIYLRDKFKTGSATFSQGELSMILGVYGQKVKDGIWRDYAIDCLPDMAVFSVFRSSKETPLYTITKVPARSLLKPSQYIVYSGSKSLKESSSLREVLDIFRENNAP